jgi:hypothetical protein
MDTAKVLQELTRLEGAKGPGVDQTVRCKAISLLRALEGDRDARITDTEWFRRYVVAKGRGLQLR